MFILNLFIGVMIDSFNNMKKQVSPISDFRDITELKAILWLYNIKTVDWWK